MNSNPVIESYGFKKTRCNTFILQKNEEKICFCGLPLDRHHPDTIKDLGYSTIWNYQKHTLDDEITDAYGVLTFNDSEFPTSKYLRIDFRTNIELISEYLFKEWKLTKPKLLISVTGGAKNFKMKKYIKHEFKKAVIEAALSTNSWFVTGGTEEGIMKIIGEAFRDLTLRVDKREKLVLFGIANWTTIRNNHLLINKNPCNVINYKRDDEEFKNHQDYKYIIKDKGAYLDSNHTHFLLVDTAQLNSYGGDIEFSSKLLDCMCDRDSDDINEIPIVLLVVGGGLNTLKVVQESCLNGTPCLFIEIEGSDGVSNILAYAFRIIEEKILKFGFDTESENLLDENLKSDIINKCKNSIGKKNLKINEIMETISKIFNETNFNLLNAFAINSNKQNNKIDEAILQAILKAQNSNKKFDSLDEGKNLLESQLKLALNWNCIETAKKYILESKLIDVSQLNEAMYMAINQDRPEFVQKFLHYGLKLNKYLTYRILLKLYNDILKNSTFYNLLIRNKYGKYFSFFNRKKSREIYFRFKDVGLVLKELTDNFYNNEYLKIPYNCLSTKETNRILYQTDEYGQKKEDIEKTLLFFRHKLIKMDEYCDKPETHLFIYAILTNKPKLAKIFLNEGRNELIGCLFASKIYKSYALLDESEQEKYEKLALEFEATAFKLVDMFYKNDPRESQLLLIRSIPEFDFTTCLQIAILSNSLNFLSHPCAQNLLVKIWYGKLLKSTSFLRLFMSILFPLIAPILCLYNEKNGDYYLHDEGEKENYDDNDKITINRIEIDQFYKKENYFERLYSFSQAPIIKFLYDKTFYLIFLLIFSYFLLCDFYPITNYENDSIKIGTFDIILIIWVYSILIEKIHNFFMNESKIFLTKCKFFLSNLWNVIYALAIVLFTIGILLRLMSDNKKYFYASRIILSFDFILWTFNFLHTYTSIRLIGPKLIMIKKMFTELLTFIFIVLAFLVGFGVSTHALNYHNIPASLNLVKNVILPSFFIIPQEFYTRNKMLYVDKCQLNQTDRYLTDEYSIDDCVDKVGSQVALVIYLVYSVFIGILMVNLLIAIFSNTISKVEEESDKLWLYQRYSLIYEYFHKPILIPPFTIFYLFGYLIKLMALMVRKLYGNQFKNFFFRKFMKFSYRYRNGFKLRFKGRNIEKRLIDWENRMFRQFLKNEEKLNREKIGKRLEDSLEIYDSLIRKCNSILLRHKRSCDKANQIDKILEKVKTHLAKQY